MGIERERLRRGKLMVRPRSGVDVEARGAPGAELGNGRSLGMAMRGSERERAKEAERRERKLCARARAGRPRRRTVTFHTMTERRLPRLPYRVRSSLSEGQRPKQIRNFCGLLMSFPAGRELAATSGCNRFRV